MIENYKSALEAAIRIGENADKRATKLDIVIDLMTIDIRMAMSLIESGRAEKALKFLRAALGRTSES